MIADTTSNYEIIAAALQEAAPKNWQKIWVSSKVTDDMTENEFDYIQEDGAEHWLDPEPHIVARVGRAIRDLRVSMTLPGQEAWQKSVFILMADGTFKFDVEYDD